MGLDEMSPGKKLQAAREAKGIALGDVSRDTRISAATLKGLEEEDFKFLPRGIYVRAFIKTYCGVLGLEAEVILDEFVEKYPDEVGQIVKSDTVTAFANEEYGKRQVAAAITIVVTVLSVVGLAVVVYLVFQDSPEASDVVVTSVSDTTTMSHNSAAGVVGPEPTIESIDHDVAVTDNELVIELAPQAECWVSAVVDGVQSLSKLMKPGEREIIRFTDRTILNIGDAGVLSLKINNRLVRPLGGNGEVVTLTIDHSNYQTYFLP